MSTRMLDTPDKLIKKMPGRLASHPIVNGRYFLTLPPELLESIVNKLGEDRFEVALLGVERELADLAGDGTSVVGFFDAQPIHYAWLRLRLPVSSSFNLDCDLDALGWKMSREQVEEALKEANPLIESGRRDLRGYCGWITTNRDFITEFDVIRNETAQALVGMPLPQFGAAFPGLSEELEFKRLDDKKVVAVEQWRRFYQRWKLVGLAAPGIPEPLGSLMPSSPFYSVPPHLRSAVTTVQISQTATIPSAKELRRMFTVSRQETNDHHLREWLKLTHPGNQGKQTLDRYARIFELSHYWRLLHTRHPQACEGMKKDLEVLFGDFLKAARETVRGDLRFITRRLGRDWLAQG